MMNDETKALMKTLESPLYATLFIFVIMFVVGTVTPTYWIFAFSVALSYLISDLVITEFVIGGKGVGQVPLIKKGETQHKGHVYISFFVGIIISTVVSGAISDLILEFMKHYGYWLIQVLFWSLILCVAVFAELDARIYKRK